MGEYLLLVLGVYACSTAVLMIKASEVHPVMLAGWRLVLAAGLLTPVFWRAWRVDGRAVGVLLGRSWLGAVLLAAHFVSWAAGARMTLAANGSLIVNLVPVAMPFLAYFMVGDRITRREVVGTVVALAGVGVLMFGRVDLGGAGFWGDVTCFVSMVLVTAYLVLSRKRGDGTSLWLYVVPLYWIAGVLCLVVGLVWPGTGEWLPADAREWLLLLGLAAVPTIVGHSLLNRCMRTLRSQVVSVANLGQFLFAGGMAWLLFSEVPGVRFYAAGVLVVAGAVIIVTERRHAPRAAEAVARTEE